MDRRTLLALILVQSLFGLLPVAGKLVFASFHPLAVTAMRVAVGAAILWVIQSAFRGKHIDVRKDGWHVAMLTALGVVINQVLFAIGLEKTSAINTTLIITIIPVATYTMALALGRETWGPKRGIGITLAFGGVVYLIGLSGFQFGWDNALGDILVLLNCLSFSLYLVLAKPIATRVSPLNLVAWQFLMAAVVLVPLGLWAGLIPQAQAAPSSAWWLMLYIILGPTVLTYVLNATALRNVSSSTVAVFIYIQPIFTAAFAYWLLGEELTLRLLPAALLVFTGVGIVAWRSKVAAEAVHQD